MTKGKAEEGGIEVKEDKRGGRGSSGGGEGRETEKLNGTEKMWKRSYNSVDHNV